MFGVTFRDYLMFSLAVSVITILNYIFRVPLYNKSLEVILNIQNSGRGQAATTFFKVVEQFGNTSFVYLTLFTVYIFCSRALAYHYTLVISTMMFFLVFMKMIIRYPRPYQVHPDIIPMECSG